MAWPIRLITNKAFLAVSGIAAAVLLVSYFLFTPNMFNTSHLESDFAFQEIKHGKAPAEKKGVITSYSIHYTKLYEDAIQDRGPHS